MDNALSQYPYLANVYAKASLLQAGITASLLDDPIGVSDPEMMAGRFSGSKSGKFARAWGPLFVHNGLTDATFPITAEMQRRYSRCEERLRQTEGNGWTEAFAKAVEAGVPPLAYIRAQPRANQVILLAQRKAWAEAGAFVEREISAWLLRDAQVVEAHTLNSPLNPQASLKRLAKFKPKAAA